MSKTLRVKKSYGHNQLLKSGGYIKGELKVL